MFTVGYSRQCSTNRQLKPNLDDPALQPRPQSVIIINTSVIIVIVIIIIITRMIELSNPGPRVSSTNQIGG